MCETGGDPVILGACKFRLEVSSPMFRASLAVSVLLLIAVLFVLVVLPGGPRTVYKHFLYSLPERSVSFSLPAIEKGKPSISTKAEARQLRRLLGDLVDKDIQPGPARAPYSDERVVSLLQPSSHRWFRIGSAYTLELEPDQPTGRHLIYQEGHAGYRDCSSRLCVDESALRLISSALEAGYSVSVLWLPWQGPNARDDNSTLEATRAAGESDEKFIADLVSPIWHVVREDSRVTLAGLSYGASVVPLYAALDARIERAVAVDPNPPFACWNWIACALQVNKVGDQQPFVPWNFDQYKPLRGVLNQFDLYLMAAMDRVFIQVLNRGFMGNFVESYESNLDLAARAMNGRFQGVIVEGKEHVVPPEAIGLILR